MVLVKQHRTKLNRVKQLTKEGQWQQASDLIETLPQTPDIERLKKKILKKLYIRTGEIPEFQENTLAMATHKMVEPEDEKPKRSLEPEDTEQELAQAKRLIKAKKFDDARAILITLDHPTADVWLTRLGNVVSPQKVKSEKDFTTPLVISIILFFVGVIPGLIVLSIYTKQAKEYPTAPGAQGLIALNRFIFWIIVIPIILISILGLLSTFLVLVG